jgi:hypothetical protein
MRTSLQRAAAAAIAAALIGGTSPARGQTNQAAGVAMFQEARKLASAGDYEHACPKFAEAQRLFPTAGTLLNLGNCYEKLNRLASAWGAFKQAEISARNAGDVERQAEAARRAAALEGSLSKLTITVSPMDHFAGFEVRRDGEVVGEGQLGAALPADPGEHVVEAQAPGRKKWTGTVQVGPNGASASIDVPELEVDPDAVAAARGFAWGPQRIAGVAVAGVGVASAIVGAVFGARAISKNNAASADCSVKEPTLCNGTGVSLGNEAKTAGLVSTGTLIAGGALVAGGLALFFTAPSQVPAEKVGTALRVEVRPRIGGGEAGLTFVGRW